MRGALVLFALLPWSVARAQTVEAPTAAPLAAVPDAKVLRDSARAALTRDVRHLASPALGGRAIGTPGLDSAAAFLAKRYVELQIIPLINGASCDSAGRCRRTYFQTFRPPLDVLEDAGAERGSLAHNVIAVVRGTDLALAGQWVIIGAHYDHLGSTGLGAKDKSTARTPHLGADDNASGTAAVLELARRIADDPPRRSVMFVHFAAEEIGLIGSQVFVDNSPVALESIAAMINLDMVGRLDRRALQIIGTESSPDWTAIIERATTGGPIRVRTGRPEGGSDHMPFARIGVPALHLYSGMHSAYHTRNDVAARIDFDGLVSVVGIAERLARIVANDDVSPRRLTAP